MNTQDAPANLPGDGRAGSLVVRGCQPTNAQGSSRAPRLSVSCDSRGNSHNTVGRHSPVHTKLSDEVRDYLADQPRFVFFAVNNCIHRGEFIDFRPFHLAELPDA